VCRTLGLPESGGPEPSGRFHSVTYDKRGGHSMPPEMALIETMAERVLADPPDADTSRSALNWRSSPHAEG